MAESTQHQDSIKQHEDEPEKKRRRRGAKARAVQTESHTEKKAGTSDGLGANTNKTLPPDKISASTRKSPQSSNKEDTATTNKKKGKKEKFVSRKKLKAGDEGFMTKTQLRNASKRKAKKRKVADTSGNGGGGDGNNGLAHTTGTSVNDDPSSMYIDKPERAPVVIDANRFLAKMLKQQKAPVREFRVTTGPKLEWRTVSKLAVRQGREGIDSTIQIGLFKPKTHQIIPLMNCIAHHPSINDAIPILQEACAECQVSAYDETSNTGQLRYVAINVDRSTGAIQVTLIWNGSRGNEAKSDAQLEKLVETLVEKGTQKKVADNDSDEDENEFNLHSLWVHYHPADKHNNAIFGRDDNSWELKYGPDTMEEVIDTTRAMTGSSKSNDDVDNTSSCPYKVALQFPPNVFRQANLDAFSKIVGTIRQRIAKFKNHRGGNITSSKPILPECLELYGGVGTIGLHLLDLLSKFVSSDENPYNLPCFDKALKKLPKNLSKKASYLPHNASDVLKKGALTSADICIVDPPRKGLDADVLDAFSSVKQAPKLQLLVYVSCGFQAFKRDCLKLLGSGDWKLEHSEGFVLFPGSDAIETLAFFVKK
jgi:tRNA/tmRNA/rRNA uracil-C5-methylase (TrmA/RlmC/RlmD family)